MSTVDEDKEGGAGEVAVSWGWPAWAQKPLNGCSSGHERLEPTEPGL